jgi:hypothetical protein
VLSKFFRNIRIQLDWRCRSRGYIARNFSSLGTNLGQIKRRPLWKLNAATHPLQNIAPVEAIMDLVGVIAHDAGAAIRREVAGEDIFKAVQQSTSDGTVPGSDSNRSLLAEDSVVLI